MMGWAKNLSFSHTGYITCGELVLFSFGQLLTHVRSLILSDASMIEKLGAMVCRSRRRHPAQAVSVPNQRREC